jgi:uncharacterized DUF497 family protein
MQSEQFEWDDTKAASNATKHGVTFEDAQHVFTDPHAIEFSDTRCDYSEDRWIRVGMVGNRLLVVAVAFTLKTAMDRTQSPREPEQRKT